MIFLSKFFILFIHYFYPTSILFAYDTKCYKTIADIIDSIEDILTYLMYKTH